MNSTDSIIRSKQFQFPMKTDHFSVTNQHSIRIGNFIHLNSIGVRWFDRGESHSLVQLQEIALRLERGDERIFQIEKPRTGNANVFVTRPWCSTRIGRPIPSSTVKTVIFERWIELNSNWIWNGFRRAVYGKNLIDVPVRSVLELLVLEALNPFYVFQLASFIIWMLIYYYFYASAIALMSITGIIITIHQTRKVKFQFISIFNERILFKNTEIWME